MEIIYQFVYIRFNLLSFDLVKKKKTQWTNGTLDSSRIKQEWAHFPMTLKCGGEKMRKKLQDLS